MNFLIGRNWRISGTWPREAGNGHAGHLYSMLCGIDTKQGGDTGGLIDDKGF